jgi:seryl-tRNA synthetase
MLDIKFIRENPELIREAARKKHINFNVDELISSDQKRVEKLSVVESLRAEQNLVSDKIPSASPEERQTLIAQMSLLKEDLKKHEEELKTIMTDWQKLMLAVPNVPDISVPEGDSDAGNMEERVWGDKPVFTFPVKDHIALCEELDLADFERGAKVAGFRGYFLKNEAVLIEMALWQMFNEKLVSKGFTPMIVPSLVNKKTLVGTGYLPGGEDDLYRTQDDEYLAGTGEVATMSYYSDEIVDGSQLPIKLAAFSPCFRREAGSHSKDTKGLIRVHEFFKLEQVVLCEASHATSVALHEEITANVEELLQELELPYHVTCSKMLFKISKIHFNWANFMARETAEFWRGLEETFETASLVAALAAGAGSLTLATTSGGFTVTGGVTTTDAFGSVFGAASGFDCMGL